MDSDVLFPDLCSHVIQLLRQFRADLVLLTEKYVEAHGLKNVTHFDLPKGNVTIESECWATMDTEKRLIANISAYLVMEKQLMQVIEEQAESLLQGESDLHEGLKSMLRQVSALRAQLEHIGATMGLKKEWNGCTDEVDRSSGSMFERKVRGYCLLNELSVWALRSVRDLRKLQTEKKNLVSKEAATEKSEL